jgi:2OG-Fe(II) oxygenase superfamily
MSIVNFEYLELNQNIFREKFMNGHPFPLVVIDDFANQFKLTKLLDLFPNPDIDDIKKSRDYWFAKNKFEKSGFKDLGEECLEIYDDLVSTRFQDFLQHITGEKVFIDPCFHGGGIHQGGKGSYLDMHVDFNYHPLNSTWFRNLNVLLYLNPNWKPEYGGQLKLKNSITNEYAEIEPIFNRCVIMFTRDFTYHGYDPISFPDGIFRRSIATYAYSYHDQPISSYRSTLWNPDRGSVLKKLVGRYWPNIVGIKTKLLGSGTAKNK